MITILNSFTGIEMSKKKIHQFKSSFIISEKIYLNLLQIFLKLNIDDPRFSIWIELIIKTTSWL